MWRTARTRTRNGNRKCEDKKRWRGFSAPPPGTSLDSAAASVLGKLNQVGGLFLLFQNLFVVILPNRGRFPCRAPPEQLFLPRRHGNIGRTLPHAMNIFRPKLEGMFVAL